MFLLHWVFFFRRIQGYFTWTTKAASVVLGGNRGVPRGNPWPDLPKYLKMMMTVGFYRTLPCFFLQPWDRISENSIDYGVKPGCHQVCDKLWTWKYVQGRDDSAIGDNCETQPWSVHFSDGFMKWSFKCDGNAYLRYSTPRREINLTSLNISYLILLKSRCLGTC